jgi:hypothetical protein
MNYIINNFINNDLVLICLISGICLTTGYFLISKLDSTIIQTPNTPPTFNFTRDQFKEAQDILDRGEELDQEVNNKLVKTVPYIINKDKEIINK